MSRGCYSEIKDVVAYALEEAKDLDDAKKRVKELQENDICKLRLRRNDDSYDINKTSKGFLGTLKPKGRIYDKHGGRHVYDYASFNYTQENNEGRLGRRIFPDVVKSLPDLIPSVSEPHPSETQTKNDEKKTIDLTIGEKKISISYENEVKSVSISKEGEVKVEY